MTRLVRDNAADPRVQHDLGVLADAYGGGDAEAAAGEGERLGRDLDVLAEAYGPGAAGGGSWRDDVVDQLRRHRALCAATALLLLMLVLVDPVQPAGEPAAASLPPESGPVEEAPATPTTRAGQPSPSLPVGGPVVDEPSPSPPAVSEEEPSFAAPPPPLEGLPAAPSPLRIVDSGYASATGGTPAEREPPDGALPVAAAAGTATELSFVRLAGTATALRLREAADAGNVNASSAVVRACKITDGSWRGARGVPLSEAPSFDADECVDGKRGDDGTWTFDFQSRRDRTDRTGFALVPGDGPGDTFQLAYSPEAVA